MITEQDEQEFKMKKKINDYSKLVDQLENKVLLMSKLLNEIWEQIHDINEKEVKN